MGVFVFEAGSLINQDIPEGPRFGNMQMNSQMNVTTGVQTGQIATAA